VPALCQCAQSQHRGVQKEALWALGSVCGSPGPSGVAAVQQAGAVPVLVALLRGGAFDIRKEAAFALANVTAGVNASDVYADYDKTSTTSRLGCRLCVFWLRHELAVSR